VDNVKVDIVEIMYEGADWIRGTLRCGLFEKGKGLKDSLRQEILATSMTVTF
jgi:hypothetical protein